MSTHAAWTFPCCPGPPDWRLDWAGLLERFHPWIDPMRGCRQDPGHHAEGDVFTHTRLVCEVLAASEAWRALPAPDRSVVFAGALFHDVAKPVCTRIDGDGTVSSRGHSRRGAALVRRLLLEHAGTPIPTRETITGLVRHHGLPLFVLEDEHPGRRVIEASQTTRCDLLALVAEADVRGRQCEDREDLLDRIRLFVDLCREERCLDAPRAFPSPHSRFLYFRGERTSPDHEAYDDTRLEVVMMAGLPGAGKDTWLRRHLPDTPVVALDAVRAGMGVSPAGDQGRVIARARALARDHLRAARSFVWNATNVTRSMRANLIDLFASYRARIRIVYLEAPLEEILRRNDCRHDRVPFAVIQKLLARLEVPDLTEAHRMEWISG